MAADYSALSLEELEAEHRRLADVWTAAHAEKEACAAEIKSRKAIAETGLRLVGDLPRKAVLDALKKDEASRRGDG